MGRQKFNLGDLVHVVAPSRTWSDMDALLIGSYADIYPYFDRKATNTYSLMLLPKGRKPFSVSWYYDHELTLLKKATMASIRRTQRLNRGDL